jgi:hypothetical protein
MAGHGRDVFLSLGTVKAPLHQRIPTSASVGVVLGIFGRPGPLPCLAADCMTVGVALSQRRDDRFECVGFGMHGAGTEPAELGIVPRDGISSLSR